MNSMVPQLGVQVFYPYGMGRGSYFPYILLNEIQTMFSQLCKVIIKGLVSGFASDHAYDIKTKGRPFWEGTKPWRSLFLTIIFW